ncbi:MAG TPA: ABC transporter ATP-binding protein [Solirubrobacteraceae bacterium]
MRPERGMGLQGLPRVIARGAKLVWEASPREVVICLVLQVICGIGLGAQLLLGRELIQTVVDNRPGDDLSDVVPTLAALAGITAVVACATTFLLERQRVLTALVERYTMDRVLDVVAAVPLSSFESGGFHDRLRRAVQNASERAWQVSQAIVAMFTALVTVVPLGIVLLGIEPLLVPAIVAAYLPLHFATLRNSQSYYDFEYGMTTPDRERSYLGTVLMGPAAVKEVRLFESAPWIRSRYDRLYDRRIDELRKLINLRVRRSLIATAWSTAITVGGLALLVHWALSGRITTADAGVAAIAIQLAGSRIRTLGSTAGSLHECSLFLSDVVAFVDLPSETQAARADALPAPTSFQTLTVDRLSFTYPGTEAEVLHEVSMTIGRDEVVALVGANGSGKTTLAKILCGLYPPTSGRVLWDATDLAEVDPVSLRRNVAAAFQDFVRYELSGRHNIGLGDTSRIEDDDAIRAAAAAVRADEPLSRLPAGYDTRLSRAYDDGADLSIGEWQRVALARAFLRDAPLLVLDEPTASLDPHSERELFDSVREVQRGRALLLISHRFSSVRAADRIYVLDRGVVIESGSHDELMAADGRYAEMFTLQAAAYGETQAGRR